MATTLSVIYNWRQESTLFITNHRNAIALAGFPDAGRLRYVVASEGA
jgi:hypothetical protein